MKNISLTCIALLFGSTLALAQGPTVYLPLDDNLKDVSGNNLHATDAGTDATKFEEDDERGKVARFPIAAHATFPLDPKLDFGTNDFSIAFWIKVDDSAIPGSDPSIISNKDWDSGGNTGFIVSLNNADQAGEDLWKVNVSDHSGQRLDWSASKNGATNLVDNKWHFVVVVFDRDATMNVYFDGELKQTVADASSKDMTKIPGDLAPDALPLTLMQDATGHYGPDFEALLDDVFVYNRVLSAAEVTDLKDNGYHAFGATVYLPFDGDLKDHSGNGLDGTDAGTDATKFADDSERGKVADFPVAAHVTLPIDPKLDFGTDDFTVAFWIKVDNSTIPGSDPSIFSNKDWDSGGNAGFVVSLNNADQAGEDLWKVNASDHSGQRLDWSASKNGATNLVDGTWHFVAVAFDRDATMNVYFDGELKQTVADASSKDMTKIPGDLSPDDLPLTIMQDATGHYGPDFAAMIDDVRVWAGKVLSADDITMVYSFKPVSGSAGDLSYGADVYLPLDADLKDATSNHVDAEDKGTKPVTFVEDDERGNVASFEAAAYAQFPMVDKLDFGTEDFSFALWIKIDNKISVASDPSIFSNKDWDSGGNVGFILGLDGADDPESHHWTLNVSDGSGKRLDWDADDNHTPNLKDGKWHFIAAAFDRDADLNVYYDGILHKSDPAQDSHDLTLTPGSLTSTLPLTIMQDGTGKYSADFAALLDDIRVWKGKVLTAEEIATMYNPEDKTYDATVFLPLNNTLEDFSGNNLHAKDAGVGATQFIKDPDRGTVAMFPTNAHATLPLVPELDFGTSDFSVGFWIRINPLIPVPSDPVVIGDKDWNSGENKGFIVGPQDADDAGSHKWEVNIADGTNRLDWKADENATGAMKDGNWHFVVVSFDRDAKMNVYFDGALKQTSTNPSTFDMTKITGNTAPNMPITLMQDGTGTYGADFSALLDNVRIWNRVVTSSEVTKMFAQDKGTGIGSGEVEIILGDITEQVQNFIAYPNPTKGGDKIFVRYKMANASDIHLSLMDIQGKQIYSSVEHATSNDGTIEINAPYESGLYLVKLQSPESTQVLKVVVIK